MQMSDKETIKEILSLRNFNFKEEKGSEDRIYLTVETSKNIFMTFMFDRHEQLKQIIHIGTEI